jgi:hypothetical protein
MPLPEFPDDAQLVLDIIRRDVKRPRKLPRGEYGALPALGSCALRWDGCKCPMGLHPEASSECPDDVDGFLGIGSVYRQPPMKNIRRLAKAVAKFMTWFDSIPGTKENARLVVEFIWPKKAKAVSRTVAVRQE